MKKIFFALGAVCLLLVFTLSQFGCGQMEAVKTDSLASAPKTLSHAELVARGEYIVTIASCADCHSPKIFTAMGPVPDSSRTLSGHPGGIPKMPIDKKALVPGSWILLCPDLTCFVGPFGISFPANLTPDSTTGLGAWTEEVFISTIRTGKHLGQAGGRPILPPMPWENIAKMTDDDLKSVFAYLQSLPPIKNQVPAPLSPADVAKMK
jgi:hypothetical protein